MKLHLVGGFLGSGKTTAIIQAARPLMGVGLKVGVVTNDQGKYLVDTAFFRLEDVPTVEVTGGCFCCNYGDLNTRLDELLTAAHPDVVFAESVGSCADLVATVVKPLLELRVDGATPRSFSAFADARLLRRRLRDDPMPFSEDVVYIFDKQLEEAGLLVINKIDLLDQAGRQEVEELVRKQYPGKAFLMQSSLSIEGVTAWMDTLQGEQIPVPQISLDIDYIRYAAGEAHLGWVDQEVRLFVPDGTGRQAVVGLLSNFTKAIAQKGWGIGHLKFILNKHHQGIKVSFTTLEDIGWEEKIPDMAGESVELLVNARIEAQAEEVVDLFASVMRESGVKFELQPRAAFQPAPPNPTHRME